MPIRGFTASSWNDVAHNYNRVAMDGQSIFFTSVTQIAGESMILFLPFDVTSE